MKLQSFLQIVQPISSNIVLPWRVDQSFNSFNDQTYQSKDLSDKMNDPTNIENTQHLRLK